MTDTQTDRAAEPTDTPRKDAEQATENKDDATRGETRNQDADAQ